MRATRTQEERPGRSRRGRAQRLDYLCNLGLGFKPRSVRILPHKAQIGTQTYTRKRWTLRQMKTPAPIESIVRDQLFKPT